MKVLGISVWMIIVAVAFYFVGAQYPGTAKSIIGKVSGS